MACGIFVAACRIFTAACGIFFSCGTQDLVPWPGIKPGPPVLGVHSLNHWTTGEVPVLTFYKYAHFPPVFLPLSLIPVEWYIFTREHIGPMKGKETSLKATPPYNIGAETNQRKKHIRVERLVGHIHSAIWNITFEYDYTNINAQTYVCTQR